MVLSDFRKNSSLKFATVPTKELNDIVTCILTLAKLFPISKFCLISRYKDAEDCVLTAEIEDEQCLKSRRQRSAQCSEASSNKSEGNLKTNDL